MYLKTSGPKQHYRELLGMRTLVPELRVVSPAMRQCHGQGRLLSTYSQVRNGAILRTLLSGYNVVSAVVRLEASVPEARQAAWINFERFQAYHTLSLF